MPCYQCGHCGKCGMYSGYKMELTCPTCGGSVLPGAINCATCGTPAKDAVQSGLEKIMSRDSLKREQNTNSRSASGHVDTN